MFAVVSLVVTVEEDVLEDGSVDTVSVVTVLLEDCIVEDTLQGVLVVSCSLVRVDSVVVGLSGVVGTNLCVVVFCVGCSITYSSVSAISFAR